MVLIHGSFLWFAATAMTLRADATAHSVRQDQEGSVGPSSSLRKVAVAMARLAANQMTMSRNIERTPSRYRTAGF